VNGRSHGRKTAGAGKGYASPYRAVTLTVPL
jgi:hypothetical protein